MEVEDVEVLVVEGTDGAQGAGNVGGYGRHRAVGCGWKAVAERCDARVGWWAVTGPEHTGGVAGQPQLACEAEDLALHAAGQGEAVRTDDADLHAAWSRWIRAGMVATLASGIGDPV